jgi:hypothetical protein
MEMPEPASKKKLKRKSNFTQIKSDKPRGPAKEELTEKALLNPFLPVYTWI